MQLCICQFQSFVSETGETIAAYAAKTKKHVITEDIYTDTRFRKGVGWSGEEILNAT